MLAKRYQTRNDDIRLQEKKVITEKIINIRAFIHNIRPENTHAPRSIHSTVVIGRRELHRVLAYQWVRRLERRVKLTYFLRNVYSVCQRCTTRDTAHKLCLDTPRFTPNAQTPTR